MPRFVILYHETSPDYERPSHWDFMLEVGNTLRTWSLPHSPGAVASQEVVALANHRAEYLTFEGPLSENRGTVSQWDSGAYKVEKGEVEKGEVEKGEVEVGGIDEEAGSRLVVRLSGEKLRGRVKLEKFSGLVEKEVASPQRWRFTWSAD